MLTPIIGTYRLSPVNVGRFGSARLTEVLRTHEKRRPRTRPIKNVIVE